MSQTEMKKSPRNVSLRDLLAHYDRSIQDVLDDAAATTTGTSRVRTMHVLSRVLTAHDSVVGSTLCPLLHDLPGGPELAGRLREGCEHRESLLARFQSLSQGVNARNVYPVFGAEMEEILAELRQSFEQHVEDETTRVGELLDSASESVAPEVMAATMAIETRRAPARAHRMIYKHPTSRTLRAIYRSIDRVHEWNDSHHGWSSPGRQPAPPVRPQRTFSRRPPSIPDLLSGYDRTVESFITEVTGADPGGPKRAAAAYRLAAAIAVHDSIVGGTLCPLLEAVPESRPAASGLRGGCRERSRLLEEWSELTRHSSPSDLFTTRGEEANKIIDQLITSFRAHETHETDDVSAAIGHLRDRSWKYASTGLVSPYLLPEWPNPEPGVLAAHMALWAEKAPTRAHPLLTRHPTNRLLRDLYRRADRLRDRRLSHHGWPTVT